MILRHRPVELQLRHTFRLARGASDSRTNLIIEVEDDGLIGLGEAAPIARYGQDWRSAATAVEKMVEGLKDPRCFDSAVDRAAVAGQPAASAALEMALRDLAGKRLGAPVYRLAGIDPKPMPVTSFTIGIDEPEVVAEKVRQAEGFAALKIKLGGDDDRALLEAVRAVTDCPLRVDANEGWTLEQARVYLPWLADQGVELVEQPLPAGQIEEMRRLKDISPLPLFADESVGRASDIPALAAGFHGINIKFMKCGGMGEALRMIAVARAHGLKTMLGCMVESSLAITAAAHLAPLVDFADLDGNLLVTNDPFRGATVANGRLVLPAGPGLGVDPRDV
ncbi:MAG: dipeptide epimerase [Deltaproteobacteria bacterium]|nr:dipeptide epimerase [Deltaproteobacteria bacterium]